MSPPPSALKQRIIGALVLAALAAIIVPFLIEMPRDGDFLGGGTNIPAQPERGFVTRVLPLNEWDQQAETRLNAGTSELDSEITPPPVQPARSTPPAPATRRTPLAPAATTVAPTSSSPSIPSVAAPAPGEGGWVVQLGSFSNEKNAQELRDRLLKQGFRAFIEPTLQGRERAFRVRVGPESQRERADVLRERVAQSSGLNAIVLRYP